MVESVKIYIKFALRFLRKPDVLAVLSYAAITAYYMGPSIWGFGSTVYGFGDNTAGLIWRDFATPNSPLGGFETYTNFPAGENSYNPALSSVASQLTVFWLLAKVFGAICANNIMNFVGYTLSAFIMYKFVVWLTRNRPIAFMAGYIVAFSPYFQTKIGGHPAYGFQFLFILILWITLKLFTDTNIKKRHGVLLGVLTGSLFYFDSYFILLVATLLIPLIGYWILCVARNYFKQKSVDPATLNRARVLIVAAIAGLITILPIVGYYLKSSSEIRKTVSSVRGNVRAEAAACSTYPHEYFIPFVTHPLGKKLVGEQRYPHLNDKIRGGITCGISEDSIGISLVVSSMIFLALVVIGWSRLAGLKLKSIGSKVEKRGFIVGSLISVVLLSAWMALPPVKFFGIPTGSSILLDHTLTWRTIVRIFVVTHIAVVALLALSLQFFVKQLEGKRRVFKKLVYLVLFLGIAVEYQAFPPFQGNIFGTFNYKSDANEAYYWLRDDDSATAIAEYPLERHGQESDILTYYLTMQKIHKKPIINSVIPSSPEEVIRSGIKDLSDPQTLPILHSLGIDTIVVHGLKSEVIEKSLHGKVEIIYDGKDQKSIANRLPPGSSAKNDNIVILRIVGEPRVTSSPVGILDNVANSTLGRSSTDWQYEMLNNAQFVPLSIKQKNKVPGNFSENNLCFDIKMAAVYDVGVITFRENSTGKELVTINATDNYQSVRLSNFSSKITITEKSGHNMRIRNLGCP